MQQPRDLLAKHADLYLRPRRLRRLHANKFAMQRGRAPDVRFEWTLGEWIVRNRQDLLRDGNQLRLHVRNRLQRHLRRYDLEQQQLWQMR